MENTDTDSVSILYSLLTSASVGAGRDRTYGS